MLDAIAAGDAAHADIGEGFRRLFSSIASVDEGGLWKDEGARDIAHWVSMHYDVSMWKAHRWVTAARALDRLPRLSAALVSGRLGIDKVLELARFAEPETEADLIPWAARVRVSTVRQRGDRELARPREEVLEPERSRFLEWWWADDGRRLGLRAELPSAEGAIVVRAVERLAARIPVMPEEDDPAFASARRADGLVALAQTRVADDADPDRATVVIHAQAHGLLTETHGSELEDGPAIAASTVKRLMCTSRIQTIVEDRAGNVVQIGETARLAPAWMLRQVRYRDRGCRFPGCGTKAFTEAHHITFWRNGGRTTLENLALICSFHHRLVHEHGWTIERLASGDVRWTRPDGTPHVRDGPWVLPRSA